MFIPVLDSPVWANQTSIGIVSILPSYTIPQLSISLQLSCLLCLLHSFVSPLDIIFLLQTSTSHRASDSVGMRETYHGPCLTAEKKKRKIGWFAGQIVELHQWPSSPAESCIMLYVCRHPVHSP
ncbi:hypothetical protein K449DRAFT_184234 [Hypoxylon sp. EC38]|nr:hypothetical protein K449DRAFT_184234 [Hypoxylon sp. EC38]